MGHWGCDGLIGNLGYHLEFLPRYSSGLRTDGAWPQASLRLSVFAPFMHLAFTYTHAHTHTYTQDNIKSVTSPLSIILPTNRISFINRETEKFVPKTIEEYICVGFSRKPGCPSIIGTCSLCRTSQCAISAPAPTAWAASSTMKRPCSWSTPPNPHKSWAWRNICLWRSSTHPCQEATSLASPSLPPLPFLWLHLWSCPQLFSGRPARFRESFSAARAGPCRARHIRRCAGFPCRRCRRLGYGACRRRMWWFWLQTWTPLSLCSLRSLKYAYDKHSFRSWLSS